MSVHLDREAELAETRAQGGDASVEYLAASQDPDERNTFAQSDISHSSNALLRGRAGFQHIGALRTKPGTSTLSKASTVS